MVRYVYDFHHIAILGNILYSLRPKMIVLVFNFGKIKAYRPLIE